MNTFFFGGKLQGGDIVVTTGGNPDATDVSIIINGKETCVFRDGQIALLTDNIPGKYKHGGMITSKADLLKQKKFCIFSAGASQSTQEETRVADTCGFFGHVGYESAQSWTDNAIALSARRVQINNSYGQKVSISTDFGTTAYNTVTKYTGKPFALTKWENNSHAEWVHWGWFWGHELGTWTWVVDMGFHDIRIDDMENWYCSKIPYWAYRNMGIDLSGPGYKRPFVVAQDLADSPNVQLIDGVAP